MADYEMICRELIPLLVQVCSSEISRGNGPALPLAKRAEVECALRLALVSDDARSIYSRELRAERQRQLAHELFQKFTASDHPALEIPMEEFRRLGLSCLGDEQLAALAISPTCIGTIAEGLADDIERHPEEVGPVWWEALEDLNVVADSARTKSDESIGPRGSTVGGAGAIQVRYRSDHRSGGHWTEVGIRTVTVAPLFSDALHVQALGQHDSEKELPPISFDFALGFREAQLHLAVSFPARKDLDLRSVSLLPRLVQPSELGSDLVQLSVRQNAEEQILPFKFKRGFAPWHIQVREERVEMTLQCGDLRVVWELPLDELGSWYRDRQSLGSQ